MSSYTNACHIHSIYGLRHSPDYLNRHADNLGKELPRIPAVKTRASSRQDEARR